jgi:hypothetical protein
LTIGDSIELVRQLGEHFLWVDTLCIEQENEKDKLQQMTQMDQIYGSAIFTIVAAAERDANAGLPGLRPKFRVQIQWKEDIGSWMLITSLSNSAHFRATKRIIEDSYWNNRGWTYQERLFSKRCLIFTTYQAYFQCCKRNMV